MITINRLVVLTIVLTSALSLRAPAGQFTRKKSESTQQKRTNSLPKSWAVPNWLSTDLHADQSQEAKEKKNRGSLHWISPLIHGALKYQRQRRPAADGKKDDLPVAPKGKSPKKAKIKPFQDNESAKELSKALRNRINGGPPAAKPIRKDGPITGDLTPEEIKKLLSILKQGALPIRDGQPTGKPPHRKATAEPRQPKQNVLDIREEEVNISKMRKLFLDDLTDNVIELKTERIERGGKTFVIRLPNNASAANSLSGLIATGVAPGSLTPLSTLLGLQHSGVCDDRTSNQLMNDLLNDPDILKLLFQRVLP